MTKFLDSIDVVIFLVVLAGAIFVLGTGCGLGLEEKDAAIAQAQEAESTIKAALKKSSYKSQEGFKTLTRLQELPDEIELQWSPAIKARPLDQGLFYHAASLVDIRDERDLELRFLPPVNLQATTDIGRIRVSWEMSDQNTVPVKEFQVYRLVKDDSKLIGQVQGSETTFVDTNVEAGKLYKYKVRAVSDDPLLVKSGHGTSAFSSPVDIRGAQDYNFKLVRYDSSSKTARVLVKRYVRDVWYEKEFDVVAGKRIGQKDLGSGVDYTTPCVALRFVEDTESIPEERLEVSFDGQGKVILGDDGKPIVTRVAYQRAVKIVKAFYRNELGEEVELVLKK